MVIKSKIEKIKHNIQELVEHTLYIKLLTLLFCIAISTLLMQSGSLFLLDYIPGINNVIYVADQQKMYWQKQYDILNGQTADKFKIFLRKNDIQFPVDNLINSDWVKQQSESSLMPILKLIASEKQQLNAAQNKKTDISDQLHLINNLIHDYDQLEVALKRDMEIKQSVVSLLQLVALLLIVSCLITIAFGARKLLIERMGALNEFMANDSAQENKTQGEDEFSTLESSVYATSARLKGIDSEGQWFSQISSERLRRMIRSQDFLHKFVESFNENMLNETSLRRGLYLLEKALNINNVALIFTENNAITPIERVLFSHHKPIKIKEDLLEELTTTNFVRYVSISAEKLKIQCLAVGFTSATGALGVLQVEADEGHTFDEPETQLLEVTAQLLSMVMGFQGREQEGRRVALLEERAAIARELHDSLAQSLSFMKIQISRLQSKASGELAVSKRDEIVNELREGLDNAYRELRELLSTFRVHMDVRGLSFAIQAAIEEFSQRSNLSITLDNRLDNCRLTVNEEFHILHVIRESLSNIVRHSGATAVNVTLALQPSGTLLVTVDDDGIGYSSKAEVDGHYGQKIMKERAYSLGGEIVVLRRRTGGTRVRLVFTPKLPQ